MNNNATLKINIKEYYFSFWVNTINQCQDVKNVFYSRIFTGYFIPDTFMLRNMKLYPFT